MLSDVVGDSVVHEIGSPEYDIENPQRPERVEFPKSERKVKIWGWHYEAN